MIDLRSDTVTRPSEAMREAMAAARVGDDVYGEDPTVIELEQRTAELLGHEAGLFCSSGSLANLLGVWLLVQPGQELLCDATAHVVRAEMGAHAALNGITTRTWQSVRGVASVDAVAEMLSIGTGPFLVETAAIALENTHNFGGGTVQPVSVLREISQLAEGAGVGRHLDGARLANASVAAGVPLADYGRLFDTVSLCLSKGLGAPVGTVLVSSTANITRARVHRKRLGGGWRQAGILAAAGIYALEHNVQRLVDDHAAARTFADAVAERARYAVSPDDVETNIVVLNTGTLPATEVVAKAKDAGVAVSMVGARVVRAVTHLDVTARDSQHAGAILGELLAGDGSPSAA